MSVKAFFMKEDRDSQASVLLHPFLHGIGELGHGSRRALLARPGHFSQPILQQHSRSIRKEGALLVDEEPAFLDGKVAVLPGAFQLRDFFFECHTTEEVRHAFFNWSFRVPIGDLLREDRPWKEAANHRQSNKAHLRAKKKSDLVFQAAASLDPCMVKLAIASARGTIHAVNVNTKAFAVLEAVFCCLSRILRRAHERRALAAPTGT